MNDFVTMLLMVNALFWLGSASHTHHKKQILASNIALGLFVAHAVALFAVVSGA